MSGQRRRKLSIRTVGGSLSLAIVCLFVLDALAQDAGAPVVDAADAGALDATVDVAPLPPPDPRVARIRALEDGTLDVTVDPQSLFDISLDDEPALAIEVVRLRALLRIVEESSRPPPEPPPTGKKPAVTPAPPPIDLEAVRSDVGGLPPGEFDNRMELDRARLGFYALPRERRDDVLRIHRQRQQDAEPKESEEERRARVAEEERQRALAAAKAARSEAERLVSEELGRIIGVERRVLFVREGIKSQREAMNTRRDIALGLQRRVRDAKTGSTADANEVHDVVRQRLRQARDDFAAALVALRSAPSDVPELEPDPLQNIPPDVPTTAVTDRRRSILALMGEVQTEENQWREERASVLRDEITTLNRERLGILPYLSPDKRAALTGFTGAAWEQAQAEVRHLSLILQYHWYLGTKWIVSARRGGVSWKAAAWAIPWLLLVAAFLSWRRRSPQFMSLVDERLAAQDRAERRATPSGVRRALRFFGAIRGPVEWMLFCGATWSMFSAESKELLEVQLLSIIIVWTLGGALVVNAINAIAADDAMVRMGKPRETAQLRLRSLQLVGRVFVLLALALVLCSRLVGEGTIYSWVYSWCWIAAIPVFLILVRWWRTTVFERVARTHRTTPFYTWVLANRSGWKSFLAAMLATVQLFALGVLKTTRSWLAGFNLARRVHAYLFRRELDRMAEQAPHIDDEPLAADVLEQLDPDKPYGEWVSCGADDVFKTLRGQAIAGQGGIVAIVGGRGIGKTSLLRHLATECEDAVTIRCADGTSVEAISKAIEHSPRIVLLDDAHTLAKPILGGLRAFDETLGLARSRSEKTLWVFAIDTVLWSFLRRARDARPIFDDVLHLPSWTEEQIATLLTQRSELAGISPSLEDLLDKMPPSADDIDKQEALQAKRTGYFRMVWDHCRGNPAMSLEVWRSSLSRASDGSVRVRPLQLPDAQVIEGLPDAALFVMRAVLQLSFASPKDVALATRLSEAEVQTAIRFGQAHGYFVTHAGRVFVPWRWLRSVLQILERRHLLVNS